jgi:hypothetical protein
MGLVHADPESLEFSRAATFCCPKIATNQNLLPLSGGRHGFLSDLQKCGFPFFCISVIALAFLNQKGGVGKATLATNVAGQLATLGNSVILIDCETLGKIEFGARGI